MNRSVRTIDLSLPLYGGNQAFITIPRFLKKEEFDHFIATLTLMERGLVLENERVLRIIESIGLALNVVNNCVVTDDPEAVPDETHWRIDHTKELAALDELMALIAPNSEAGAK